MSEIEDKMRELEEAASERASRGEVAYPFLRPEGAPFTPDGYIYVLRWSPCDCHPPRYKVGRTHLGDRRIVALRIQLPFALSEADVLYRIPCEGHRECESDLHWWLREYHTNGEWFEIPEHHWVWDMLDALAEGGGWINYGYGYPETGSGEILGDGNMVPEDAEED
jgi:hypothetical protein